MAVDQIDVVESEAFDRLVDRLQQVLAVERVEAFGTSPWMPQKYFVDTR